MRAASVGEGPAGLCSGVEGIDVAAGQTWRMRQSVCRRAVHSHFSDCIREVGFPTTAAGNIDGADYVDSLLVTGWADLYCRVRPILATADAPSAAPLGDHLTAAAPMCRTRSALPPATRDTPPTEGV
jgi:2,4-dienoyl-CoA reductase-like NADH-dependent reductase (Old Yellow Enzyme family)